MKTFNSAYYLFIISLASLVFSTEEIIARLEEMAPGFKEWAKTFEEAEQQEKANK